MQQSEVVPLNNVLHHFVQQQLQSSSKSWHN
jgi:hypothetical protein